MDFLHIILYILQIHLYFPGSQLFHGHSEVVTDDLFEIFVQVALLRVCERLKMLARARPKKYRLCPLGQ